MTAAKEKRQISTAGQAIKTYRQLHGITQKQLAIELGVEPRTLRMYENGERALDNITDLQRIADLLAIEPELLGLASRKQTTYTTAQIYEVVDRVWSLIPQARLVEAHSSIDILLQNIASLCLSNDAEILRACAYAHIAYGYAKALVSRTAEATRISHHFQEAARLACLLHDQTLFSFALSYHAEILRRQNKVLQSITQLENAQADTPQALPIAQGNNARLLARAYLSNKDLSAFEQHMCRSLQFAQTATPVSDHPLTLHCPGLIYEEYARGYGRMGKQEQSLRYLALAENHLPPTHLWDMMLKATRTEALIYGNSLEEGLQLAVEVVHLAQTYGHQRLLERLYALQCYLDDRAHFMHRASRTLNDILHGQAEP